MIPSTDDYIKSHEGLRLYTYDDATGARINAGDPVKGTLTAGYGHTGSDVTAGMTVTQAIADAWFQRDLAAAMRGAIASLGTEPWMRLDWARRCVLVDMCFELGEFGLSAFHKMLAAVRGGEWTSAASEMMASEYAEQVPNRAKQNQAIMLSGGLS